MMDIGYQPEQQPPQQPTKSSGLKQVGIVLLLLFVVLALYFATRTNVNPEEATYSIGNKINARSNLVAPLSPEQAYRTGQAVNANGTSSAELPKDNLYSVGETINK